MRMKKWICVAVCAAVLLSSFGTFSIAADEPADWSAELELLNKLGVLTPDFEPVFTLERGEMCAILINCLYPGADFSNDGAEPVFDDVTVETPFYHEIKACKELKIINGSPDNTFSPARRLTAYEVITMLINAMQYTPYAEAKGGYPSGYLSVAYEIGLLKGVDISGEMIGSVIAKMLYNALFADLVTVGSVTNNEIILEVLPDKNLLSERLGIEEYDARVIDNGITSLTGDSLSDSQRVVLRVTNTGEKITAYTGESDIAQHLGSRLKVFVKYDKETGRNEVLTYYSHKSSSEIMLNADRIINVTADYIEYEKEPYATDYRKISLNKEGAAVVINGIHKVDYTSEDLNPDDGILRIADCDGDNRVDFIEVLSFNIGENGQKVPQRNLVAANLNPAEGYIGCKFNPSMGITLDESKCDYRIVNSGEIKTLSDIAENDVVSIAQAPEPIDNRAFYFLMVKRQTVEGTISSMQESDQKIIVGDTAYPVSDSVLSVKPRFLQTLPLGETATFYLDCTGKVAYMEGASAQSKEYAYLIGLTNEGGLESLKGKFFLKTGEIKILEFRGKVKVDGVTCTEPDQIAQALIKRDPASKPFAGAPADIYSTNYSRPVILKTNSDDLITEIDTDNPNTEGSTDLNYYTSEHFLRYTNEEVEDSAALKAGYRAPRTTEFLLRNACSLSGRFYVTADTVIMNVPDIDVYGLDQYGNYTSNKSDSNMNQPFNYEMLKLYERPKEDSNYQILSPSALSYLYSFDIQGYDIDPDTGVAGLAVVRGRADTFRYGTNYTYNDLNMAVFLRTTEVYDNAKDKMVKKIYYTTNGSDEMSATADTDDMLFSYRYLIEGCKEGDTPYGKAVPALKKGDIIRVTRAGSNLAHLERVFRLDEIATTAHAAGLYPSNPRSMYSTNLGGIVTMPNDQRGYYNGPVSQYTLTATYPKSLSGGNLTTYLSRSTLDKIVLGDPATYLMQTGDISAASILVIHIDPVTGEIKTKTGTTADIKTVDETKNLEEASIVVQFRYDHSCSQIVVINR